MVETIGWIGTVAFSLCAIPQAYKSYRTKKVDDVSAWFLILWGTGEICMLTYVLATTRDPILFVQYLANLLCLFVIIYYKMRRVK